MAIVKGARRAHRALFVGFSAVFGFILLLIAPSLRVHQGDGAYPVAHADAPVGGGGGGNPGGGGPCPAPGPCGCGP
jgi:hypothetical protein